MPDDQQSPDDTIAALHKATYVFGVDHWSPHTGGVHAISQSRLQIALRRLRPPQTDLPHLTELPHLTAAAMCGVRAGVATSWGPWSRTSPHASNVCPECAWYVAIDTGAIVEELVALRPTGATRASLEAIGAQPDLLPVVCDAIITANSAPRAEFGLYHPRTLALLAHVTRHGPTLLLSEECSDRDCDCDPEPCPGSVACAACSLQAGSCAGEWEGQYDQVCTIPGPCEVFREIAQQHGVTVEPLPREVK